MAGDVLGLLPHLVTIRRETAGSADGYGNTDATYTDHTTGNKARVQHHNSWEDREDRRVAVQNWRCYLDPTVDVTEKDMLYWEDEDRTFEILLVEPVYGKSTIHHMYMFLQEIF